MVQTIILLVVRTGKKKKSLFYIRTVKNNGLQLLNSRNAFHAKEQTQEGILSLTETNHWTLRFTFWDSGV